MSGVWQFIAMLYINTHLIDLHEVDTANNTPQAILCLGLHIEMDFFLKCWPVHIPAS